MRLIDADKLMKSLKPKESVWVGLVLSELIDNAPTVKAIPIEWIKDKMDKLEYIGRLEFCEYLDELLVDWEKENE